MTCPITFTTLNSAQLILFIQSLTDLSSEVSPLRKRPLFMKARRGQYFSDEPFRVKKGQKSFRLNYGNMWQAIVQETIASALLWDDAFVELLSTAVVELSKSTSHHRHVTSHSFCPIQESYSFLALCGVLRRLEDFTRLDRSPGCQLGWTRHRPSPNRDRAKKAPEQGRAPLCPLSY